MVVDVPRLADGHNYESFMSSTGSRTRGYSPFGLRVFQTLFYVDTIKPEALKPPAIYVRVFQTPLSCER